MVVSPVLELNPFILSKKKKCAYLLTIARFVVFRFRLHACSVSSICNDLQFYLAAFLCDLKVGITLNIQNGCDPVNIGQTFELCNFLPFLTLFYKN